jgi:ABC-type lipoprotein release transport system permease subunit
VAAVPGVAAAAPRYEVLAADSFLLGETVDLIAYPGDHTAFEAPPLTAGRRLRSNREAEVGTGLAAPLGLSPGSLLAVELPSGQELRFRVTGLVSSFMHDGRVAYVPADALLAADPGAREEIAVRLRPGADPAAVRRRLFFRLGARATPATGAAAAGHALVSTLARVLRVVAIIDGLVCLYALTQALALTVQERRATVSVLRACGAGGPAVRRLLAGAALAVLLPAALIGAALERVALGPAVARIAASYVSLSLQASGAQIALVLAGLTVVAAAAVWWVARRTLREPIVSGLAQR